jgi:cytochrome c2
MSTNGRRSVVALLIAFVIASAAVGLTHWEEIRLHLAQLQREAKKIQVGGDKKYVEKSISDQYGVSTGFQRSHRVIESAVLPLDVHTFSLNQEKDLFAQGGGSVTIAEGNVVVLDRLGNLFLFEDGHIRQLKHEPLPTRLADYVLHSDNVSLNSTKMRAHSVAFDPASRDLYVAFTQYENAEQNYFLVSRIDVEFDPLRITGNWTEVYRSDPVPVRYASHGGGGKVLIENGTLYFALGYDAVGPHLIGRKVVSTSQDRNPQGMTIATNGQLLATDQGPQGGDEINVILDELNHGWPYESLGTRYGTYDHDWPMGATPKNLLLTDPMYAFIPSIGISSILSIRDFDQRWNGDLLVGSLKAQSLYRLRYVDGRVVFAEPIWLGERIRDITEIRGKILLLTDTPALVEISVNKPLLDKNARTDIYFREPLIQKCFVCHHFGQTNPTMMAPSLTRIVGREISSDSFANYSQSLNSIEGVWTRDRLVKFLSSAAEFAPGTTMPTQGLSEGEAADIVDALANY